MNAGRENYALNGWIIIDKPATLTSNQALSRVKRALRPRKAGYAGTLDPLATGVLPIALGEATKTIAYVTDAPKIYRFTVRWGEERDTDDAEGEIVATSADYPDEKQIRDALKHFVGEIEQIPPKFSAIKVAGERAYKKARAGQDVVLQGRPVEVMSLDLLGAGNVRADFRIECGKGFYVRSLARDLGRLLRCYGHIEALRREKVGPFTQNQAILLDKLEDFSHSPPPEQAILPVETALADIPALAVTGGEANRLRSGQSVRVPFRDSGTVRVVSDHKLVALAENDKGEVKPFRVFNL